MLCENKTCASVSTVFCFQTVILQVSAVRGSLFPRNFFRFGKHFYFRISELFPACTCDSPNERNRAFKQISRGTGMDWEIQKSQIVSSSQMRTLPFSRKPFGGLGSRLCEESCCGLRSAMTCSCEKSRKKCGQYYSIIQTDRKNRTSRKQDVQENKGKKHIMENTIKCEIEGQS